jgi:anti-anti-sigma factor
VKRLEIELPTAAKKRQFRQSPPTSRTSPYEDGLFNRNRGRGGEASLSQEFTIEEAQSSAIAPILRVAGRLHARSAEELLGRGKMVLAEGRNSLVLNLGAVSFVSSSGIGVLFALTEEFRDAGGCLRLVSLSDAVRSVLEILNLTEHLNVSVTEADALRAIGARAC